MTVEARSVQEGKPGMVITLIGGGKRRTKCIELEEGINLLRERIRLRARQFRIRIENAQGCRLHFPDGLEILLEEDSDL